MLSSARYCSISSAFEMADGQAFFSEKIVALGWVEDGEYSTGAFGVGGPELTVPGDELFILSPLFILAIRGDGVMGAAATPASEGVVVALISVPAPAPKPSQERPIFHIRLHKAFVRHCNNTPKKQTLFCFVSGSIPEEMSALSLLSFRIGGPVADRARPSGSGAEVFSPGPDSIAGIRAALRLLLCGDVPPRSLSPPAFISTDFPWDKAPSLAAVDISCKRRGFDGPELLSLAATVFDPASDALLAGEAAARGISGGFARSGEEGVESEDETDEPAMGVYPAANARPAGLKLGPALGPAKAGAVIGTAEADALVDAGADVGSGASDLAIAEVGGVELDKKIDAMVPLLFDGLDGTEEVFDVRGLEFPWWFCWPLFMLFLESLLPLARPVRMGEEMDEEKEKEPLCLFLSFSDCCNGGLVLVPEDFGELGCEAVECCGNVALLGVVAGVVFADEDSEEEGQTRPTKLFLRSRHVNGLGRERSVGTVDSTVGVGVDVDRRMAR
ncbi:hypothetical protein EDD21DRAFT_353227 [Dissophora ornata]|nr:hypothetical protein EDD21DRAFT_353227 [Dissophora ornata]